MPESIDQKIDELVAQIETMATRHKIVEIMSNNASRVVFTGLDIFGYLRDHNWVDDEEKERPKQFYLCSLSNDHACGCVRDEAAFANRHFKKAFDEGGNAYFEKKDILHGLEVVVNFLNEVLIDMYDKGYIKDEEG